jgi:hypothetical protein
MTPERRRAPQKRTPKAEPEGDPITAEQAEFLSWLQVKKLGEEFTGEGLTRTEADEAIEAAKQRLREKREVGG